MLEGMQKNQGSVAYKQGKKAIEIVPGESKYQAYYKVFKPANMNVSKEPKENVQWFTNNVNIHVPNNRAPKYVKVKQKWTKLKGKAIFFLKKSTKLTKAQLN